MQKNKMQIKKHPGIISLLILSPFYLLLLTSKFDYHDNLYRYTAATLKCGTDFSTSWLISIGRPLAPIWHCGILLRLTNGIASTYQVRLLVILSIFIFLYLLDKSIGDIFKIQRIRGIFILLSATTFGVMESTWFLTSSLSIVSMIITLFAFQISDYYEKRRVLQIFLLYVSLNIYQFGTPLFVTLVALRVFTDIVNKIEFQTRLRKYGSQIVSYVVANLLYFCTQYILLSNFRNWNCNTCFPGERSITISPLVKWPSNFLRHSEYAFHVFGPFINPIIFVIPFLLIIFTSFRPYKCLKDFRTLSGICVGFWSLSLAPLALSNARESFFRTLIPQQIFLYGVILLIITNKNNFRRGIATVLLAIMALANTATTYINIVNPIITEVSNLQRIDFTDLPPCVIQPEPGVRIRVKVWMRLPKVSSDEWGSISSNFEQDVLPLLRAIKQMKEGKSVGEVSDMQLRIFSREDLAIAAQCKQSLYLDDYLVRMKN